MEEKRLALLVGISNYEFAGKLRNPLNDVDSMNSVLSKLGFQVDIVKDATYKEFKLALNSFGTKLNDYDIGLFYFAGHGIQVKGMNYLITADSNPLNENQVEFDCINANQVLSLMNDASNIVNIIVLDACRNNPFERYWQRSPTVQGLSYMSAPSGTLIAYSTSPDRTASDGPGDNGLYTSVFIDEVLSPNITILKVLQNVRSKLIKLSNSEQIPWESTSLLNDFVFNDNRYVSVSTFCQSILYTSDKDLVLNNLKLDVWDLMKLSKLNIPVNPEDKAAGVKEIYFKNNLNQFDLFTDLEIHIYENGERDYNLYAKTNNYLKVIEIAENLYNQLGGGIYDDEKFFSFKDVQRIENISNRTATTHREQCFTMWIFDDVSFVLKYLIDPYQQFVLTVNIKPSKKIIKRTILEFMSIQDYFSLLPKATIIEPMDEHKGKFVDYSISLNDLEFGFFEKAIIRVFKAQENLESSTSVFLSVPRSKIRLSQISNLVAQLTAMYGVDDSSRGYLSGMEEQDLQNDDFWTGRTWHLNIQHQNYDNESAIEEMLYGITLNYHKPDDFQLSIYGYEKLLYQAKEISNLITD